MKLSVTKKKAPLIIMLVAGLVVLSGLILVFVYKMRVANLGLNLGTNSIEEAVDESELPHETTGLIEKLKTDTVETVSVDLSMCIPGIVLYGDGPMTWGDEDDALANYLSDILEARGVPIPVVNMGDDDQDLEKLEEIYDGTGEYKDYLPIFYINEKGCEDIFHSIRRQQDIGSRYKAFPDRYLIIGPFVGNMNSNKAYDYLLYEAMGDRYLNLRDFIPASKEEVFPVLLSDNDRHSFEDRTIPNIFLADRDEGELNDYGLQVLAEAIWDRLLDTHMLYKEYSPDVDRSEAKEFVKTILPGIGLYGVYDEVIKPSGEPDPLAIPETEESFVQIPAHQTVLSPSDVWLNEINVDLCDTLYSAGFHTLRIPIAWESYCDEEGVVSDSFLREIVGISEYFLNLSDKNKVIISGVNDNWNKLYFDNLYAGRKKTYDIWHQVANAFADLDERVIFDAFHRVSYEKTEWENSGGSRQAITCLNYFQDYFVDAVRDAKGYNRSRYLIINGYGLGGFAECFDDIVIPDDGHLLLGISSYNDFQFTVSDNMKFDDDHKQYWDLNMDNLQEMSDELNIPLIMTEVSCVKKDDDTRERFLEYACDDLNDRGIPYIWFDNGYCLNGNNSYGLIHRSSFEVYAPEALEILTGEKADYGESEE